MTEKRKSFLMNSPFRFFFSLFMAVILFLSSSMTAGAAVTTTGDLALSFAARSPHLYLQFFNNYTSEGSDRDNTIPYSYQGIIGNSFTLGNNTPGYYYVTGYLYKRITYDLVSQAPGISNYSTPRVSVLSSSLPDGVTCSVTSATGDGTSFYIDVYLYLDRVFIQRRLRGNFTLIFQSFAYASAEYFGSAYGQIIYQQSVASDWVGEFTLGETITDLDRGAAYFYNNMNSQLNTQQSIYSRLGDINTNISNQGTNVTNKIQSQITNDNANTTAINNKIQSQINNDNSNTTKTINALNANSKSEVDSANKNSQNEIDTANQNADDIMHSYDSGSQEDKNAQFDSSQKQLQDTEDNLFGSASGYFSGLDFSLFDIAKFTSVVSSLSFVSGLLQSLYIKMGDFGLIVTVGMVIMIASKVIGVYRFSTGDHGKGG